MKVSHKSKAHRTQLSPKKSVGFWKLHSRFFEFINTFYAYDSTWMSFLDYFKMHSCIQTSSIQIDSQRMQTFTAQSWTPQCHQEMSEKCSRFRIYLQIFTVTIKQIPTDNSLTASTNVISMQYPNTILNTKRSSEQAEGHRQGGLQSASRKGTHAALRRRKRCRGDTWSQLRGRSQDTRGPV